jgi:hypothetical protein
VFFGAILTHDAGVRRCDLCWAAQALPSSYGSARVMQRRGRVNWSGTIIRCICPALAAMLSAPALCAAACGFPCQVHASIIDGD